MTRTVSCIIPAWNEAARIGAVLDVAVGHPCLCEVIVVDDASTDETAKVASARGATVLRQARNGGKSAAVARGLAQARGEYILFLDADLIGLTGPDITRLIRPVLSGEADATISLRINAPLVWRIIGLDYISGERVMARGLLLCHLDRIAALRRFGLEVFLNDLWIGARLRPAVVRLPVRSPMKSRKHGLVRGILGDLGMLADILRTIGPAKAILQIVTLRLGLKRSGRQRT